MATEATMPDPGYPNVRRWPRFKLDVPIRLIATKRDKLLIVQGRGNELNEGGMSVFGGMELNVEEIVSVEFTPPYSGQPIRVRARVVDRQGYNYGVTFLLETEDDLENVSQLRAVLGAMGSRMK
jgi:PilZ domain